MGMIVNCFKVRSGCKVHICNPVCVHSITDCAMIGGILEKDPRIHAGFSGSPDVMGTEM